jgi:hypothetical protein
VKKVVGVFLVLTKKLGGAPRYFNKKKKHRDHIASYIAGWNKDPTPPQRRRRPLVRSRCRRARSAIFT